MYKIYADKTLIYDSTKDDYKIVKGSISLELNKAGSFTFSLYPDHFYYDKFQRLKTLITVYRFDKVIFKGRVLKEVIDYWNNKVLTCENAIAFLGDSIIRPFEFTGTVRDFVLKIFDEHNAQVDDFKKLEPLSIGVEGSKTWTITNYETPLTLINQLVEEFGGYYYTISNGQKVWFNYYSGLTSNTDQKIEFGSNLTDFVKTISTDNIATVLIPLGADQNTYDGRNGVPVNIESVNDGKDYIESAEGIELYGRIVKTVKYDDVTDPNTLKTKAQAELDKLINHSLTIEVTALDLRLIDENIRELGLNEYIEVISEPHNFDEYLRISKITYDLLNPENDRYTLGEAIQTFTSASSSAQGSIENIKKNFATKTLVHKTEDTILLSVSGNYATSDELDAVIGLLELKVGTDEYDKIVTMLNASATDIYIGGNRITITSDYWSMSKDGIITAKKGYIGGWTIENDTIHSKGGLYDTYEINYTTTGTDQHTTTISGYLFYALTPYGMVFSIFSINEYMEDKLLYRDNILNLSNVKKSISSTPVTPPTDT